MLRVYACIAHEHDIRLLGIAGVICFLAALTAFATFGRAQAAIARRYLWVALAGVVAGIGIWATHFLAMLAYEPGIPIRYHLGLTSLSVLIAVAVSTLGWQIALRRERAAPFVSGAVMGLGVAAMHYTGMAAVITSGRIAWDPILVLASPLIGIVLASAAITLRLRRPRRSLIAAAALLSAAVCSVHFTAMSAATLYPDARIVIPDASMGSNALATLIAVAALLLLCVGCGLVFVDRRISRAELEEARHRAALADEVIRNAAEREQLHETVKQHAAISTAALDNMAQGLSMFDRQDRLVIHNRRFAELYDVPAELLEPGTPFQSVLDAVLGDGEARCMAPQTGPAATDAPMEMRLANARVIEIRRQRLPEGGWIATHADVTERNEADRRIAYLAAHDVLTGLPNRAAFAERLKAASERADEQAFALLTIDLDRFKEVNDTLGHPLGDQILKEAASRLLGLVGATDMVTRLGGDEFAILQRPIQDPSDAEALAGRVIAAIGDAYQFDGHTIAIGASIGISIAPLNGVDPNELLKMSDLALYKAKADSRGTARLFEPGMATHLHARRTIENDLRIGIREGQFEVHYQPLLDVSKGRIGSFEALVRWRHPTNGLVQPVDFIPIAEESGLIIPIGEWVLRQACRDAATWPEDVGVAVNLSPAQFKRGDLVAMTTNALAAAGLAPERLELEITESVLLHDEAWVRSVLDKLTAFGVGIAMDDFGTGYSSLSYLRSFPFTKIKIDSSFVADLGGTSDALAIVQATIQLSEKLGMKTTAEGVETAEQLRIRTEEGCSEIQGYHVSRPVPADRVFELLGRYDPPEARLRQASFG